MLSFVAINFHYILAQPIKIDLGFIFGADGSDPHSILETEKKFAKKLVGKYHISPSAALTGGVLYGKDANILWRFTDARDLPSTMTAIDKIKRRSDGNNVLKALQAARDDLFSIKNGARRNVPKTVVVFATETECKNVRVEDTAQQLKDIGIDVMVVAIGPDAQVKHLSGIASTPSKLVIVEDPIKDFDAALEKVALQSKPGIMLMNFVYKHYLSKFADANYIFHAE